LGAFWAVWAPRGPLARRMIDARSTSLHDVRSEFSSSTTPSKEFNNVVLSKFSYGEMSGFLFLENIVAMSPETTEELHAGKTAFRFPIDETDPDHYKKFGYVEVTKINSVHKSSSWLQDKRYDLNTYAWDQHVFGDRSIRKFTAEISSNAATQEVKFLTGAIEIDDSRFAEIKGRCFHRLRDKKSMDFPNGTVPPKPAEKHKGASAAKAKQDPKQSVELSFGKDTLAFVDKYRLFVELELPVIDKRYPRPDKFDNYPLFRGDFPMQPPTCKGQPGPDECPDFFADGPNKCPSDCAYIVKLRGLRAGGGVAIHKQGDKFVGTVPYLAGQSLALTAQASCKAKISIVGAGSSVNGTTSVPVPAIALPVGKTTLTVTATAANSTQASATLELTREAPSSVHTLAALTASAGKLVQVGNEASGFDPAVLEYNLVDTNNQVVSLTPTLATDVATLAVDGKSHTSGKPVSKTFTSFGPHQVVIRVTGQDGSSGEYRVHYRRGSADNRLSKLQVYIKWAEQKVVKQVTGDGGDEQADKETYTVEIPDDVDRVKIVATPAFAAAKLYMDGEPMARTTELDLPDDDVVGEPSLKSNVATIVTIEVEAQNLLRRAYELKILRPKDDEQRLEGDESDDWLN
jgi:hypothetical protein